MIEFHSFIPVIIVIVGFIIWTFDYYNIFKSTKIFAPGKFFSKPFKKNNIVKHCVFLVGVTSWILFGIALARPRLPIGFSDQKIKVNDLYFVVDVSRSMLAEDFIPNRMEVAKKNILEFIKLRPTDRIGLILFAREVFTLMPLTTDLSLIEEIIADINVGRLGSATNIGDSLGLAVARLMRSGSKNKIIILITDGVNNAGNMEPLDAAEVAHKQNIKIYTIGVGSLKGAKLPIGNTPFGKKYQNIPGGSIDLDLLKNIAKITDSKFYLAENEGVLKDVLTQINTLEKTEIKIKGHTIYKELYLSYLIAAVLLLSFVEVARKMLLREIS